MANKVRELSAADWDAKYWSKDDLYFHLEEVHPMLEKYYDVVFAGDRNQRVFVPLCGKSVDIIWLANKGHQVVGVEFSEIAVKGFFDENKIDFTVTEHEDFAIYSASNLPIHIYQGDFFKVKNNIGKFDVIWDRGSYVAVNPNMRQPYTDIIRNLLNTKAKVLLISCFYESQSYTGPPFATDETQISKDFGSEFTVTFLEQFASYPIESWNIENFEIFAYLLKLDT